MNHPITQQRIVLFCDDFLYGGSREVAERFYTALAERFECKDPTWLSVGSPITFTGMDISLYTEGEQLMYSMGHGRDLGDFLHANGLGEEQLRENPMADKRVLTDTTKI